MGNIHKNSCWITMPFRILLILDMEPQHIVLGVFLQIEANLIVIGIYSAMDTHSMAFSNSESSNPLYFPGIK